MKPGSYLSTDGSYRILREDKRWDVYAYSPRDGWHLVYRGFRTLREAKMRYSRNDLR